MARIVGGIHTIARFQTLQLTATHKGERQDFDQDPHVRMFVAAQAGTRGKLC